MQWGLPDVQEAEGADVRRIAVVDQVLHVVVVEVHCEQTEQQAKGARGAARWGLGFVVQGLAFGV